MRATVAKRLRRVAEAQTEGAPLRHYRLYHEGKLSTVPRRTIVLTPGCTRQVYRALKRGWR